MIKSYSIIILLISSSFSGIYGVNRHELIDENSFKESMNNPTLFNKPIHSHPRLLFTSQDEKRIQQLKDKEPLLQDLLSALKINADKLVNTPLVKYALRARHSDLLMSSREHLYRIITLSQAYRMFDDIKYAQKAKENLVNICNYPNWDQKHFLDVAK